ncbi:hypothetical protein RRG08_061136 [Elysia crispata]|uniref:Uncharacterized protein n=1 Tax=Elysia crispata TaxID=231223 RepID=A0AAE0XDE9_9GAST|nr:hypothetical protein RRG08_061136 [Elysia crispata]
MGLCEGPRVYKTVSKSSISPGPVLLHLVSPGQRGGETSTSASISIILTEGRPLRSLQLQGFLSTLQTL